MITLEGNWVEGYAFDIHTVSSEYQGEDDFGHSQYNTIRTEMGELVYQLKYQDNPAVVNKIVDLLQNIKGLNKMDVIIPIPPSNQDRTNQPVYSIATELGCRFGITVYLDALGKSKESKELKEITDPEKRQEALKNAMHIAKNYDLSNKNILLIDDLYRSGATLKVATELLYSKTKAKKIYVLTMTKTRTNR